MKRVVVPELLDDDRGTSTEIQDSLADLRMLNQHFGGVATTTSLLRQVAERASLRKLSFLDAAGATGHVAQAAASRLLTQGVKVETTVLDRAPSHLTNNGTTGICGSALQLPFADASFDVVGSCLFLHHLEPEEVKRFLHQAMRVSRHAVIVNDLRRDRLHWLAATAGGLIYRSSLTRHDAPVSVRRAYTMDELRNLIREAGYPSADFAHHFFYRMGVIIWRNGRM
jgi:ubiquinone/menaquinone biosynthesis C-methylase UbiE